MRRTWRTVRLSLVRENANEPYGPQVRHGGDVARVLASFIGDDPRERFVAVYLDARHRIVALHTVSVGTADASTVHPREVFGPGLMLAASALVVAHNHPSGDLTPSREDRAVTERLREAGTLLGLELLDHLILGHDGRYYSFAEEAVHTWTA